MKRSKYRTAPVPSREMPGGVPYIVGNEGAERFSYYGMKAFLVIFMTKFMMDAFGNPDHMTEEEATAWFHTFGTAVYFLPALGAIISDVFLGKYRTIIGLSLVYCAGHAVLFLDQTRGGLGLGLALIAIGSGGIKPCVSAHVGDQFGRTNEHLLKTVMNYFYMAINVGAGISIFLTPWLLENYGPHVAFGTPGALMFVATIVFWMGRHKFVHIPPGGIAFAKEAFSGVGLKAILKLAPIFAFVAVFWSLFDQTGSTWVLQSEKLNRNFLGFEWLSSQIQAINPVMIIVFVPLMAGFSFKFRGSKFEWEGFYAKIDRVWKLTPLRKIGVGFFIAIPSFLIPALIESQIAVGEFPSIAMQVASYAIITIAEVFISITCLEFAYTQAPKTMKSMIMALFLMSVSLGNFFTAGVNFFIQNPPPSFTADKVGDYELELSAHDGTQEAKATVEITAVEELEKAEKKPGKKEHEKELPEAKAGRSMAVWPGEQIRMYATASKGDSRGAYVYAWKVKQVPEGSKVSTGSLSEATTRNPTFVPDVEGEYVLEFTVTVGPDSASSEVTVICSSGNLPAFVNAGKSQKVKAGTSVVLNGGETYDPNFGDELQYRWRFVSVPEGSKLTDSDIVASTLTTATSKLKGAAYYNFFAIAMLIAALLFIPLARWYKEETHLQDEA